MATDIPFSSVQPNVPPSAADWTNFKELIIRLYEENSLNDVREHLRSAYNFVAT
jgi:hypothetical protein